MLSIESSDTVVFRIANASGEGVVVIKGTLPGVSLIDSDFHMSHCLLDYTMKEYALCIDYCLEGRSGWEINEGEYAYLDPGAILINAKTNTIQSFEFPEGYFRGISLVFNFEEIESLNQWLSIFSIVLYSLKEKFCNKERPFILLADLSLSKLFTELINISKSVEKKYLKLKILDLLIRLKLVDAIENAYKGPFYHKEQIKKYGH